MGVQSIDKATITQFSDIIQVEQQQIQAKLRPFVRVKPMIGKKLAFEGLGIVEATEASGRITPTVFNDIDHLRRLITGRRFVVTLPIDDMDVRQVLINPEGEYAKASIAAMERVFDDVGVEALFADVKTGADFETTVTYTNDGGLDVDATAGLTYAKLLEMQENWINRSVGDFSNSVKIFGITGKEHTALMQEAELTSGDFSRQFVVDKGEMQFAAGFLLLKFAANAPNPIIPTGATERDNFAMTEQSLCYGLSKEMSITIKDRPEFVDVKQLQITGILGAVRTEGKLVQKVRTLK